MLDMRSIPFLTPLRRMKRFMKIMMAVHRIGRHPLESESLIMLLKKAVSDVAVCSPSKSSPVSDIQKYSKVQPATTI